LEIGTGMHPEMTARENIYLNGAILGMKKREITCKFDEIIEFAGCAMYVDTPIKRFSSGMRVRIGFAVAAHLEPEIMIVDEVLAVGDLQFQKKCLSKMSTVGREGGTVIFVSHNLIAVNQLCSRCVLMDQGKMIKSGTTAEIVSLYSTMASESGTAIKRYDQPLKDGVAAIRSVSVCNNKDDVTSDLEMSENFNIHVEYELGPDAKGICVGITVIGVESNQSVISLPDPELDFSRLETREVGFYRGTVTIPGGLLNSGTYRIRVGITRTSYIFDVKEDVTFTIQDRVGILQALGYERKSALLSLQLPWQIKRSSTGLLEK
jgi:lipopolysaccharide transport system ATP-binding protein